MKCRNLVLCGLWVGMVCPAVGQQFHPDKKLLQWGWGSPTPKYIREHITEMQKMPFDGIIISVLLIIPSVTDWDSASGLPIARTRSPTRTADESPKRATGNSRPRSGFSLMTAMSVSGSIPISSASTSSRLDSVQNIRIAWPAT